MTSCNMKEAYVAHDAAPLGSLLFERDGHNLRNIKFHRQSSVSISEERMKAAIHSAIFQKRTGLATTTTRFADIDRAPMEIDEIVKGL